MLVEETASYNMYAKTGAALLEDGEVVLWYVGFIEDGDEVSYFAFNMHRSPAPENAQLRIDVARDYLQSYSVI